MYTTPTTTHLIQYNIHRVQKKRCHWFFCCNFYRYWQIFIIFVHNFARECQSHWRKKIFTTRSLCCTIPCESLRHKSNTFHTNISTLHMFISITFTETSIDETNKTAESQRLKIYVQNVHHSREHMHSNDYATAQSLPRWRCAWSSSRHSPSRRSFNFQRSFSSHHGSTSAWSIPHTDAVVHRIQIWRIRWPHRICKSYSKKSVAPFFLDTVYTVLKQNKARESLA